MSYRFAVDRADYSDLAGGRVLYSAPGHPGFPVRLASELFLRAAARLDGRRAVTLWDPCCGSGALAASLGFLHGDRIAHVLATDVAADAVELAERNLSLLTEAGLTQRERELRERAERFDKPGYLEAADSAVRLRALLRETGGDRACTARRANVFDAESLRAAAADLAPDLAPDLAIFDVPYGETTQWLDVPPGLAADPTMAAARAVARAMPAHGVLAVVARTRRIAVGDAVPVLERLRIGTRAAVLLSASAVAAAPVSAV